MYKNYKIFLFLGAAAIFLYYSAGKYEDFSMQKSISACAIAKSKIKKELKPEAARLICEKEIKNQK